MSLKSAIFQLKEAIIHQKVGPSEEDFIKQLETEHKLRGGTLPYYFNFLMMVQLNDEITNHSSGEQKKINRKWTKHEIEFMFHYIKERQEEGGLNITELLDEVAQLLDRGYQSVNYKYYSAMKSKDREQASEVNAHRITTIFQERIPVLSTEVICDLPPKSPEKQTSPLPNDDLLDILSGLITNVQKLPGINLNELLKSLYLLTNMALQNQEAVEKMDELKSAITMEKETSREKVKKLEQQLFQEKQRNDSLQLEVSKLAKEILAFNQLGDAAKIQNLKSYNQRLNYIIDGFGVVLQVGG
ncbi:hypothetical protein RCG24_06660 [Neobacillus sp. OS1-32]|uniref:Uncharacterized protein n=1 Tax=Neobacillus paridis TaxID=2803862 RepID=A0ABS1TNP9_9BACI|nr:MULTISPECIES: hypothetical protein [Neobacillus]MBL4952941.1 hypothetical protein [Neobacillus paridis]WML31537.1 hypothetical protein RCG24_06660 [Neobacillus sp. OS1-32]